MKRVVNPVPSQENPKLICYLDKLILQTDVALQIFGPRAGFQMCFALNLTVTKFCTTPKIGKNTAQTAEFPFLGIFKLNRFFSLKKTTRCSELPEHWPCFEERTG